MKKKSITIFASVLIMMTACTTKEKQHSPQVSINRS